MSEVLESKGRDLWCGALVHKVDTLYYLELTMEVAYGKYEKY